MNTIFRITFDPAKIPGAPHALTSEYVERFWLPIVGPTATVLLRTLGHIYAPIAHDALNPQTLISLPQLATALGVGSHLGRNGALRRSLTRLQHLGIVEITGEDTMTIATYLPHLRPHQIERLPAFLQTIHPQPANA